MEDNKKYKILFVCLGNICRSPAGQGVMERIVDERGLNDRIFIDSPEEMDKVKRIASFFRQYRHWDCIPDPYYGGSEGFENVLDLLDDACQNIADQIETKQI